ncbi:MAG: hypothetical protein HQL79_03250 [Magnetococcales bacterium]|nr:hypothetical protein [Magnetococcales bacterium]
MSFREHRPGLVAFFCTLGFCSQLLATPPVVENSEPPANVGRYQIYQGQVRGAEGGATLMLDSQLGRVWILTQDRNHEAAWVRVPLAQFKPLQEGYMSRPTTAIPSHTSKAKVPKPRVPVPGVARPDEAKPEPDKIDKVDKAEPTPPEAGKGDIKVEPKP